MNTGIEFIASLSNSWRYVSKISSVTVNFSVVILYLKICDLQDQQPRDDYRELLELILIFGGSIPPGGVKFRYPGALSRARWMMYLIYGLKVWMFRNQFSLTKEEETGLRQLCLFCFCVYVERWYTCPLAISAPNQDLTLFHELSVLSEVSTFVFHEK